jgi:branched-chain amino acid transport system substrate-binding protein
MEGRTEGSGGEAKKTRGVPLWAEPVSRRSVLKGVGVGALALGSGGFLQACSNSIKGSGSSTAGKITIGFVSPQTGALAGFASGDNFVVDTIRSTSAYKSGFKVGSKRYTVEIIVKDSQSDPNRASQVTSDLILQNHADLVVTSSTPETTNPVATVCETQGVPCVSTVVPWEAWYFPRQADPKNPQPFKFTTMYFFGVESFGGCFIPMWDRIPTNKIVAGQWPNDPDGSAFRGAWPGMAKAAGYTMVDGGAYADGTTDYTSMINKFKAHDCEIFTNRCHRTSTRSGSRRPSRGSSQNWPPWPRCCCSLPTPRGLVTWSTTSPPTRGGVRTCRSSRRWTA